MPPVAIAPLLTLALAAGSPCVDDGRRTRCDYGTHHLEAAGETRRVHVALPDGEPPAGGWPVVFAFQGSFFPAELFFRGDRAQPFGGLHQGRTVRALLDAGFAVVAPEARGAGLLFWESNLWYPSLSRWEVTSDHALMLALFAAVDDGRFGALARDAWFAMGVSSGGYMTSRVALAYPERFERLAIVAASWATCGGALCVLPDTVPADHPPTLFLHGARDAVVPLATARRYAHLLRARDIAAPLVVDEQGTHGWPARAPIDVVSFFREALAP